MAFSILGLLLIPLIAMQFTAEVDWDPGDFLVMGMMLAIMFSLIEIAIRAIGNSNYRMLIILAIIILFLLTWAELGVGIFGTPFAGD